MQCVDAQTQAEVARGAAVLTTRLDDLARRLFDVLSREPAVLAPLAPEFAAAGLAVARADLAHELDALAASEMPVSCPPEVTETARRTVALGAPLALPLACYRAGHRVLGEAWREHVSDVDPERREALTQIAETFFFDYADRCCAFLVEAHAEEVTAFGHGIERRHIGLVREVLTGAATPSAIGRYALGGAHVALIATGRGGHELVTRLASQASASLVLALDAATTWAWVRAVPAAARALAEGAGDTSIVVGVGERAPDIEGFARTHRQARAALRVALARGLSVAAFDDVALEALVTADPLAARDFVDRELAPILDAPILLATLAAWLESGLVAARAARRLEVSERTVNNRLRVIEGRLGGAPLRDRATRLDVALTARMHRTP